MTLLLSSAVYLLGCPTRDKPAYILRLEEKLGFTKKGLRGDSIA